MHHHINDDDGWSEVATLIAAAGPEPVSTFDVARLRRRVREGIAAEAPARARWTAAFRRLCVAAAAAGFATVTLVAFVAERAPADGRAPVTVARTDDGGVVIRFADGKRSHRVVRSDDPAPTAGGEVAIARGTKFVDRRGPVQPGEIVFYRID